ncbi:hypothetical protein ACNPPY_12710 [Achromobacter sp. AGC78]|jgi:hypothetical protein|uniref:Lipoprotein n=1 Tax=Achromobacter spanius TaxID=217203 RepID=A0AA42LI45_9BURK|nr:hypothetical protein [Achromobacter spanius]MDH0735658.1 hypothetical protein [Achromobacter spanius]
MTTPAVHRKSARRALAAFALLALPLLAGCDNPDDPPKLTLEQRLFKDLAPHREFKGELNGQQVHLIVHECEVFLNEPDPESTSAGARRWTKVLEPEFYPSFMDCQRQSLSREGQTVEAIIGEMAMGAGGCCATGGRFRSKDGREWKPQ